MAAAITDLFTKCSGNWSGQIGAAGVSDESTQTIPLSSATGLPTDTAIYLMIGRVDASGAARAAGLRELVKGVISGSNLTNCTRGVEWTAQAFAAGTVVEYVASASQFNSFVTGMLVEHNQSGTHKGALVTTLKSTGAEINTGTEDAKIVTPKGIADAGFVRDTDGTLAANSDLKLATQKATKTYIAAQIAANTTTDGWTADSDTWVYVSASSFKIAGKDVTTRFTKGTRLKFTQTTVKYAVVVSSAFSTDTTVTIAVNTDYTIANAAISANYYSYQASPQGYPTWFNWTPTYGATGSMTFGTVSTTYAKYFIIGSSFTFRVAFSGTTGGSASNAVTFTTPVNRLQTGAYDHICAAKILDTANQWGQFQFDSTAANISVYKASDANWGTGANKGAVGCGTYDI